MSWPNVIFASAHVAINATIKDSSCMEFASRIAAPSKRAVGGVVLTSEGSGLGNVLVEVYHALVQTIGVGGSLLVLNVLSVIRRHFGVSELRRLFFATSMGDLEAKETARASVGSAKGAE